MANNATLFLIPSKKSSVDGRWRDPNGRRMKFRLLDRDVKVAYYSLANILLQEHSVIPVFRDRITCNCCINPINSCFPRLVSFFRTNFLFQLCREEQVPFVIVHISKLYVSILFRDALMHHRFKIMYRVNNIQLSLLSWHVLFSLTRFLVVQIINLLFNAFGGKMHSRGRALENLILDNRNCDLHHSLLHCYAHRYALKSAITSV